jgi:hypothetical protein
VAPIKTWASRPGDRCSLILCWKAQYPGPDKSYLTRVALKS